MPTLKDLTCSIELSDDQTALQEFGTIYGDGCVETFIPVPSKSHSFSVHLSSKKFIAPGIAMYVFIDGVYQCNRNRQDLKLRKPDDRRSLVDFRVRQKEEKQKDGSMIAREWTFEKLNASANDAPDLCSPNILDNIGCIEVIVLRCAGPRNAKNAPNMNLDGAGDVPDFHFSLDGPSDGRSIYDDRLPFSTGYNGRVPSVPSQYRSPYAETARSREGTAVRSRRSTQTGWGVPSAPPPSHQRAQSRYSEPVSPGTRPKGNISLSGVQYGSGPIPRDESDRDHTPSSLSSNTPMVDPAWLDKLVTTAVKRGVEEARRNETPLDQPIEHKQTVVGVAAASQPPGAWPMSPFSTPVQVTSSESNMPNSDEDRGTTWSESQSGWQQSPARSRAGTRVTWNEEPVWDSSSQANGWASLEDNNVDSWDTDETWATKNSDAKESSSRGSRSRAPVALSMRHVSPGTVRTRRSRSRVSRPRGSTLRNELSSSSEDNEGWTHVERASTSDASWEISDDTVRPEQSRSQVLPSRSKSKKRAPSHHSERPHAPPSHYSEHSHHTPSHHDHKQTHYPFEPPIWHPASIAPTAIPMNAPPTYSAPPPSAHPAEPPTRKVSMHTEPALSVAPPPSWGCAVPEKTRVHSMATTYTPPAPYGITLDELVKSTKGSVVNEARSASSSSWGVGKNGGEDRKAKVSGEKTASRSSSWESGGKVGGKMDLWGNEESGAGESSWGSGGGGGGDGDGAKTASMRGGRESSWGESADQNYGWGDDNGKDNDNDNGWGTSNVEAEAEPKHENTQPPPTAIHTSKWPSPPDNPASSTWATQATTPTAARPAKQKKRSTAAVIPDPLPPASHPSKPPKQFPPKILPLPPTIPNPSPSPNWRFPPPPPSSPSPHAGPHHEVRTGAATKYGHVIGRPAYVDGLDRPYAVFRFKYRSREVLGGMFGRAEGCGEEKKGRDDGEKDSDSVIARGFTERWVERHSRRDSGRDEGGVKVKW
ncbi:hypothetical protein P153DRAFT_393828 [Dothidotthia symphoricarpi CBS 119687]|uniref:Uncharacterized protein n=1 Tax=Dothidotthia symphoricarpi CBS 119687 TaxID=1392245 RepID=A0A6A6APL7_9PLEO|nr:uncharacterized protein P153DRAFT_393828 [Dothidotthia symphoricarpi CBS 119687]KAF2132884.1 hypothetical protein P153DRAFT_393828 [Dothidotthia symphoricarpi CBS 119687]